MDEKENTTTADERCRHELLKRDCDWCTDKPAPQHSALDDDENVSMIFLED